ncbi:MAG: hypothetical protein WBH16_01170 [Candidatus Nanopelagicales bacterium]
MPTPRTARVIAFMLALSVGLVGFGAQATASEFTKKVKKTVTVYTSAQKTWDRTDTDGGPEGGSAGDIVYFSGQYFPTLAAARSMEGPKKHFLQIMTRVSNGTIIDGENFWWMENSSFLPGGRIDYQGSFKMPNTPGSSPDARKHIFMIIGGTGEYFGARGTVVHTKIGEGLDAIYKRDFRLAK